MIQAAKGLELKAQSGDGSVSFDVVDCAGFSVGDDTAVQEGNFDKVYDILSIPGIQTKANHAHRVSNAALHWILRNPATRVETLRSIYRSLNPGGTFAFELGGHGNIAEMHTALLFGLKHYGGLSISEAEAASPWFFPSDVWMRSELEKLGFEVKECKLVHRPTFLEGGVEGWVRLMGANMIEVLEEGKREAFVKGVCEVLQSIVSREDGGKWLGYVRLRGVAVKK